MLGKYPAVKLKDAAQEAPIVLSTLAAGRTPAELEAERLREEARRRKETFASAVADFIADGALAGLRSGRETEAILRRDFLGQVRGAVERDGQRCEDWVGGPDPLWSKTPVAQIARRDVIARLDAIKRRAGSTPHGTRSAPCGSSLPGASKASASASMCRLAPTCATRRWASPRTGAN